MNQKEVVMCSTRMTTLFVSVLVLIGCGGKPQDAAAKTDRPPAEAPIQLAQAPAQAQPSMGGGSSAVTATVKFEGAAPARAKVKMDADPVCQQQHATAVESEEVVVNGNGTLKNVFVYVKEGVSGTFPSPTAPATLEQAGCWYRPMSLGCR